MKRRLLTGAIPLLATVALGLMATSAQGVVPRWWNEGADQGSEPAEVILWGSLAFTGTASIECEVAGAGTVENPAPGHRGYAFIPILDFRTETGGGPACVANYACPVGSIPAVRAQDLPWTSELFEEAGKIRDEIAGVKFLIGCEDVKGTITGTTFVSTPSFKDKPLAPAGPKKGTSALHPGYFEWDAGSGELEAEGSGGTVRIKTEGYLKILGIEAQQHIYVQNS